MSDTCTVVDLCPQIEPQLFLDVGHKCRFGQKAEDEKDAILDSLCDPDKEDNACANSVEKIFTDHVPKDVLNCLYHSSVDFDGIKGLPDNLNVTNVLKQILDNDALLQYSTFTNFGCALLYKPDKDDDSYAYEEDDDYQPYTDTTSETDNTKMLAAGGALLLLGVLTFQKLRGNTKPIVSAADDEGMEDEDDEKMKKDDPDKKGLIEPDDEEI